MPAIFLRPGGCQRPDRVTLARFSRGAPPEGWPARRRLAVRCPDIPAAGWAAVVGGTVLLGPLATIVPIRRVLQISPVEAIGVHE